MKRGFKSEANAIAREVRKKLLLTPSEPLDIWKLAEYLGIPLIPLSDFEDAAPSAVQFFTGEGEATFSGVTVFKGPRRTIVHNDAHTLGRQSSDIGHELAHALLQHEPTAAMDGRGCRLWNREIEDEADWLGATLLIPEEAAMLIVRRGWPFGLAATKYGVSEPMIRYRVNVTAAKKRVQRFRGA